MSLILPLGIISPSDITTQTVRELQDEGILEGHFANNYKVYLNGYEEEFGYVIESTYEDLLNCSDEKREAVLDGILDVYNEMNPELISKLGTDAVFVIEEIK